MTNESELLLLLLMLLMLLLLLLLLLLRRSSHRAVLRSCRTWQSCGRCFGAIPMSDPTRPCCARVSWNI